MIKKSFILGHCSIAGKYKLTDNYNDIIMKMLLGKRQNFSTLAELADTENHCDVYCNIFRKTSFPGHTHNDGIV
jgi:hypothetical protein